MIKPITLYETGDGVRHDTIDKAVLADRTMAVDRFLTGERDRLGLKLDEIGRLSSVIATAFAGLLPILQKDYRPAKEASGERDLYKAAALAMNYGPNEKLLPGEIFIAGEGGALERTTAEAIARRFVKAARVA